MMQKVIWIGMLCLAIVGSSPGFARDYVVSIHGDDTHEGTAERPFRTIQRAAEAAQPGDTITVRAGVYRERVNPPRGGTSDNHRIVYQAAPGERVTITGSEPVTGWEKVINDTWKVELPNTFFGDFNPYSDEIGGDWFHEHNRRHHTGAVYLNGHWLWESESLDDALAPVGEQPWWFARVEDESTTIWAQFPGVNPNEQDVEINARQTVFYPDQPGRDYITVRGFDLRNAATPWAPPTAEQIGLIGTHWSCGWIIENNAISYSRCTGVTLGKYGDEWDNKAGTAEGYVGTIKRAIERGWSRETVGHHLVRGNVISHCEQAGLVGSMGAIFSSIKNNEIHDIHVQRLFGGYEQAGIKIHGAVDSVIADNHIYRCHMGAWLDWMTQGTIVMGNLMHSNRQRDLFIEVSHGPFVIANNILLSQSLSLDIWSQGGAMVHNLAAGRVDGITEERETPVFLPHSVEWVKLYATPLGDLRFHNNLFLQFAQMQPFAEKAGLPMEGSGNVYLAGASPMDSETDALVIEESTPEIELVEEEDGWYLRFDADPAWRDSVQRSLATTETLGLAVVPNQPFTDAAGEPISIDTDYFGIPRDLSAPFPGPFEQPTSRMKVWPK